MLYVVATPIGNLEDLSFRALRILREVDLIAAEDTRRTAKLLAHYEIRRPLVSLREHNEIRETPRLIARLKKGESIALVSDAGTPGISDPGTKLVRSAHLEGIKIVPIPGPSAVATALSASGFPADQFVFAGFPPRSGEARQAWFEALRDDGRTTVFFEAPHRIERTLEELESYLVERPIMAGRELTKTNENLVMSPSTAGRIKPVGEFTIVVGPPQVKKTRQIDESHAINTFSRMTENAGFDETTAAMLTASLLAVKPREIAKIIKKHKISVKRQTERVP
jgi:16S rRNA (cytidine1402-2'-O)-methyltransferase